MIKLRPEIESLANWCQLGFVAKDLKVMMARLVAVGIGPFKIYSMDTQDMEAVNYRGAPADYSLEVAMAEIASWTVEIIVPVRGGKNIYTEYLDKQPEGGLLEFPRFRGHLILWENGGHDAKNKTSLSTRVSPADSRASSSRAQPR